MDLELNFCFDIQQFVLFARLNRFWSVLLCGLYWGLSPWLPALIDFVIVNIEWSLIEPVLDLPPMLLSSSGLCLSTFADSCIDPFLDLSFELFFCKNMLLHPFKVLEMDVYSGFRSPFFSSLWVCPRISILCLLSILESFESTRLDFLMSSLLRWFSSEFVFRYDWWCLCLGGLSLFTLARAFSFCCFCLFC